MTAADCFDVAQTFFNERRAALARDAPEKFWSETHEIIMTITEAEGGDAALLQELLIACFQALELYSGCDRRKAAAVRLAWAQELYQNSITNKDG